MTLRSRWMRRATIATAGIAATALTASACGTDQDGRDGGGKIDVVASTSAWGSIAEAVGGDSIEVESLIDNAAADPHSYESTPRDAATVSNADLVVFNGGGYDGFIEQIMSSNDQHTPSVRAIEGGETQGGGAHEGGAGHEGHSHGNESEAGHEGHDHGSGEAGHGHGGHSHEGHDHSGNEHVWYDLHVVHETAERIADELAEFEPGQAQQFHDAAARFSEQAGTLEERVEQIAANHAGTPVIATEPIAHYLIEQAGLRDVTPQEFVHSVESGNDPSATAVAELQNTVNSGQAAVLIHNPQTESPVTKQLRTRAEHNHIPVVEMTETLPAGTGYVQWMRSQISDLENALDRKR